MDEMEYPELPRAAVGVVVFRRVNGELQVLLVKRGQPPNERVWAVPGGSIELGETLEQAAEREVLEETSVKVRAREVVHAFDVIERDEAGQVSYHYVVVDLLAEWIEGEPRAGDDALDARWFSVADLREMPREDSSEDTQRLVLKVASDQ